MNASSYFDKAAYSALLIIFFAVPMTISFSSYDQFGLPKFFLTVILGLVASVLLLLRSFFTGKMFFPRTAYIPMLFFGLMTVSCVLSADFPAALWGSYKRNDGLAAYFSIFVVMLIAFSTLHNAKRLILMLNCMGISTFLLSIYGILQFFGFDIWSGSNFPFELSRSFATFGNPDLFASFQVLTLPIFLFFIFLGKAKYFYYPATFIVVFAMISSGTRAGLVGFIAGLTLLAIFQITAGKSKVYEPVFLARSRKALIVFALISIISIATVSVLASGPSSASNAVGRLGDISATEGSTAQRIQILEFIPNAVAAKPIFGDGNASFRFAFEKFRSEEFVIEIGDKLIVDNAHNIYLQYLVENGIFVMLAFIWLLLFVVFSQQRALKTTQVAAIEKRDMLSPLGSKQADPINSYLLGILTVSAVSYGLDMLFSVQEMVQALIFWGLIAVIFILRDKGSGISFTEVLASGELAETDTRQREREKMLAQLTGQQGLDGEFAGRPEFMSNNKAPAVIAWLLISVLMFSLFVFSRNMFEADVFYKASLGISATEINKDALVISANAPKIFPGYIQYRQKEIEDLYVYSELYEDEKALDKGILKAEALLKDEPREIDNYAMLTRGQLSKGLEFNKAEYFRSAAKTSSEGIKISPYWISGYKFNAQANFYLKNYKKAYRSAETAFQLEPHVLETETLRDFYRAQSKIKETGILIPQD